MQTELKPEVWGCLLKAIAQSSQPREEEMS